MATAPSYHTLRFELHEGIATITLNRPERYNAFNNEMSMEFIDALKHVGRDAEVRAVVLTGEGKAFCSGQDLKDVAGIDHRDLGDSVERRYNPMVRLIYQTEKPFICRLNGVAAGAGAGVALACDYVVAAEDASLLFAFAKIGLVLDSGASYILPRLVGVRKAFELTSLPEPIAAREAERLGLINRVVPMAELDATVADIAQKYAHGPTKAIAYIKRMLHKSTEHSLEQALESERAYQQIAGRTEDYVEGVTAFLEKRAPVYKGR